MDFTDCHKSFDPVEHRAIFRTKHNARIDSRYKNVLKRINDNATFNVKITNNISRNKIGVGEGVRQEGIISPKMFTLALTEAILG